MQLEGRRVRWLYLTDEPEIEGDDFGHGTCIASKVASATMGWQRVPFNASIVNIWWRWTWGFSCACSRRPRCIPHATGSIQSANSSRKICCEGREGSHQVASICTPPLQPAVVWNGIDSRLIQCPARRDARSPGCPALNNCPSPSNHAWSISQGDGDFQFQPSTPPAAGQAILQCLPAPPGPHFSQPSRRTRQHWLLLETLLASRRSRPLFLMTIINHLTWWTFRNHEDHRNLGEWRFRGSNQSSIDLARRALCNRSYTQLSIHADKILE